MSRKLRVPKYRLHKPSGQALVEYQGKRRYLGRHGSEESLEEYARIIAEIKAAGEIAALKPARTDLTVNELILCYLQFADGYYRKRGKRTGEYTCVRDAMRPLKATFGHVIASEFSPPALKQSGT